MTTPDDAPDASATPLLSPDTPLVDEVRPSPNHGARAPAPGTEGLDPPVARRPSILVLHYTGMSGEEVAIDWLANPTSGVSCHYVVRENGGVVQMVREDRRAHHAGVGVWEGERDVNSASIGIEISNRGHDFDYPDFPAAQVEAVATLARDICERHGIAPERVIAHSDCAPSRKRDPGEKFPWAQLHALGVGHYVPPVPVGGGRFLAEGDAGPPVEALQLLLSLYGYGLEATGTFDAATADVVRAFQRHFRPERVDAVADASTIATLHALLAARPSLSVRPRGRGRPA